MISRIGATLFTLLLAVFSIGGVPMASASAVSVDLVSELQVVSPEERFYLGVRFELEPKWHIYWKNPGSSGYGVRIDWDVPDGVTVGAIEWPAPERFEFDGFTNYGYSDVVTLLVPLELSANASEVLELKASVSWLACKTSCIPGSAELELQVPLAEMSSQNLDQAESFKQARASLPKVWSEVPISYDSGRGWATISLPETNIMQAYFYAETTDWLDADAPQVLDLQGEIPLLKLQLLAGESPENISGVLDLDGHAWKVELQAKQAGSTQVDLEQSWEHHLLGSGLAGWLLLAFLGGVLLNIMPCVLPVLSLKVFSLLKHSGQLRRQALAYGLAYTSGVVLSFVALAAALFVLRGLGERIGWGFQLQNPAFVVALALLLFVFALNLVGVFEMGLGLVSADSKVARRKDLWGSFGTGILAAVVGAPCVGPLVGGASGVALQADPLTGIAIFAMLGFGMAAPFLLLSIFPRLVGCLPKPGPWMETFKQLMGFVLFAVVVFLLWVVGQSGGKDGMMALLLALLLASLAAWIYGRWAAISRSKQVRQIASALALLLLGLSLWGGAERVSAAYAAEQGNVSELKADDWEAWSEERVARELAAGRPVFVDFTASWCLICQVNKRTALRTRATRELFKANGIVPLEADWTTYDAAITDALEAHGRSGVPLYLLHTPDGSTKILPQNLTPAIIRRAVESAL
ncbi:MAG: Thiol:disulfide interchange protein DsbD [Opitutia bacterium UBA7350]|nr:MAG: Thiol:disulfide interchange protein DsbD [Opitutae bacterium UBA7350]